MYACTCVGLCAAIYMNANIKLGSACLCVCHAQPTESLVGWELGKKHWSMNPTRDPP